MGSSSVHMGGCGATVGKSLNPDVCPPAVSGYPKQNKGCFGEGQINEWRKMVLCLLYAGSRYGGCVLSAPMALSKFTL